MIFDKMVSTKYHGLVVVNQTICSFNNRREKGFLCGKMEQKAFENQGKGENAITNIFSFSHGNCEGKHHLLINHL